MKLNLWKIDCGLNMINVSWSHLLIFLSMYFQPYIFVGNLAIFPNISYELEKMIRQNRSLAKLFSLRPSISFQVAWKPSSQEQTLTFSIFSHLVEPSGKRPIPSGFLCCAWVLHIDVSWVVDSRFIWAILIGFFLWILAILLIKFSF